MLDYKGLKKIQQKRRFGNSQAHTAVILAAKSETLRVLQAPITYRF